MSDLLVQKYLRYFDTLPSAPKLGDGGILLDVSGNTATFYICQIAGTWTAVITGIISFATLAAGTNNAALVASNLAMTGTAVLSSLKINDLVVADAELAANEVKLYFDPTNGAGKLLIKGKTANGTVVTGEVALT